MIVAVDFDGTVVFHRYPKIGKDIPGAVETLKKLIAQGHNIVLFTMRCKQELDDAVKWFEEREIPLYGINVNPDQITWTDSPKAYAQLYIDDAGIGCPCGIEIPEEVEIQMKNARLFVDWEKINEILIDSGFLV